MATGLTKTALTRLMANLLYKVSPNDPLAFGSAFLVMTLVSLIACFLPLWWRLWRWASASTPWSSR